MSVNIVLNLVSCFLVSTVKEETSQSLKLVLAEFVKAQLKNWVVIEFLGHLLELKVDLRFVCGNRQHFESEVL